MNSSFLIIEYLEAKILEEYRSGNFELASIYQDLLLEIYKIFEKNI